MKRSLFLILLLLSQGLFSQNVTSVRQGNAGLHEGLSRMQLSLEDQGYLVKSSEVIVLMDTTLQLARKGMLDTLSVLRVHSRCRELMYFALRQRKMKLEEVKRVFATLDSLLGLFTKCDQQQSRFHNIFLKDSSSRATLEAVVKGLSGCHCQNTDLYMKAAKRFYDMDTSLENAMLLARYFLAKNGYGFAIPLLQKVASSDNPVLASEANMEIAGSYRFYNRTEQAVELAQKAVRQNPGNGMAYVIIGDCYYQGAIACGDNDLMRTGALWASYDKYQQAFKADPSLKDLVDVRSGVLTHRFPDKKILSFHKLSEGDPFKVDCWIKETTKVRVRKGQ